MYQVPNQYNQMIYNNSNNPSIRNVYNSTNAPSNNNYQNYPTNNQDQSKIPLYFGPKKVLNYYLQQYQNPNPTTFNLGNQPIISNSPNNNNYQNYPINHHQEQNKTPLYIGPKKVLNLYLQQYQNSNPANLNVGSQPTNIEQKKNNINGNKINLARANIATKNPNYLVGRNQNQIMRLNQLNSKNNNQNQIQFEENQMDQLNQNRIKNRNKPAKIIKNDIQCCDRFFSSGSMGSNMKQSSQTKSLLALIFQLLVFLCVCVQTISSQAFKNIFVNTPIIIIISVLILLLSLLVGFRPFTAKRYEIIIYIAFTILYAILFGIISAVSHPPTVTFGIGLLALSVLALSFYSCIMKGDLDGLTPNLFILLIISIAFGFACFFWANNKTFIFLACSATLIAMFYIICMLSQVSKDFFASQLTTSFDFSNRIHSIIYALPCLICCPQSCRQGQL